MATTFTELEAIERNTSAWTLDAYGCHVRRGDVLDCIAKNVTEAHDPFAELIAAIKGDGRKTFSKAKLLELIAEHRP